MKVDRNVLGDLSEVVSGWEKTQARSESGEISEETFENRLDRYLSDLERFETQYEMSKIGEGRHRVVFTSGSSVSHSSDTIVKISRGEGGIQNREEIEIWKQMDDARDYVAHLIHWSPRYTWIIQERVDQGAPPSASEKVLQNLEDCGWTCSDVRPDNVGMKDGSPVLIDLGVGLRKIG